MSAPRLHVVQALAPGSTIPIAGERVHYLRNVLRLRDGAELRPFNGVDGEWLGRMVASGRHRQDIQVENLLRHPAPEPGPTLIFAPIRRNRLDWLVEKAVELGVARLVPVLTRRTVARPERSDRLQAIAIEAAEQCERLTVPAIATPIALAEWLRCRDPSSRIVLAAERGPGTSMLTGFLPQPTDEILIGPEGGFADDELTLLHAETSLIAVTLGRLILRSETAALAALAAWQLIHERRESTTETDTPAL